MAGLDPATQPDFHSTMTPTVKYDPASNAAYIRFSPEPVEESEEVSDGIVLDHDAEQAWELIQNLRKEKGADDGEAKRLANELDALKKSQAEQRDAFATALGIKPEETSDTDKLAQQLNTLREQMAETQRKATLLEVAAAPGVDAEGNALPSIPSEYHHLLTATEMEALQAQAKSVAALVAVAYTMVRREPESAGNVPPAAAGWHGAMELYRNVALWAGKRAMQAEVNYWKAVG